MGYALARAIGDAGINKGFMMAQVISRKCAAVFGFENEADVAKAATLIKTAAAPARKRRRDDLLAVAATSCRWEFLLERGRSLVFQVL
jgi:hypothetical protein